MAADTERSKMDAFVGKLWENPALKDIPVSRKENQILNFLKENSAALEQTLRKQGSFSDMGWEEILRLFLTVLTDIVLETISPRIDSILERSLASLNNLSGFAQVPDQEQLKDFLLKNIRNKALRDKYVPVVDAIHYNFYQKYVPEIIQRRKLIYIDLIRRDRLDMESNVVADYLGLASLFRPLFFYAVQGSGSQKTTLQAVIQEPKAYQNTFTSLQRWINEEVGLVDERIFKPGIESCLSAFDFPDSSGAARMISIMVNRAAEYEPLQKIDRGAESADKSWFHINRRNAKFYGYDAKFLEELYQIAGEKGW